MDNYGFYSYLIATLTYSLLLPAAIKGIKKHPFAIPYFIAVVFSVVWAGLITISIKSDELFIYETMPFETLRNAGWFYFLAVLVSSQQNNGQNSFFLKSWPSKVTALLIVLIFILEIFADYRYQINQMLGQDLRLNSHVIFAVIGLVIVEQLYRNVVADKRWGVKFLCLGLGAIFFIDFIVYSKSLLFNQLDENLWNSRGMINALVVPLLAISMGRLQTGTIEISLSRKVVFHTTVLFGTGLYLIVMSLAGFYIRDYGGSWGEIAQIIFIFLAILVLLTLFISGKIRALVKVFFNKHFFHYSYDYRVEWVKLSKKLAQLESISELSKFTIKTMADLVESSGGGLWLKNEWGDFYLAEQYNLGFESPQLIKSDQSLINFLVNKQWVVDFVELSNQPEIYHEVDLTQWDMEEKNVWLIVPLFRLSDVEAIVVLTQARVPRRLNWEDHDLLKTVGMQLANALARSQVTDELLRSRQFEAYNRLSAYIVHDLKNLLAQIALILKNAEKHKSNPDFFDDAIDTLENVVSKMQHLVMQLKKGNIKTDEKSIIDLVKIIADVALQQAENKPAVATVTDLDECLVYGEKEKMTAILGHLVQNAQEATSENGIVKLELTSDRTLAIVEIIDNGSGMDQKFISERLFKPFDTTKGNAGIGIGVYEARDYILKHAGQINVESAADEGTTFTIRIPLMQHQTD